MIKEGVMSRRSDGLSPPNDMYAEWKTTKQVHITYVLTPWVQLFPWSSAVVQEILFSPWFTVTNGLMVAVLVVIAWIHGFATSRWELSFSFIAYACAVHLHIITLSFLVLVTHLYTQPWQVTLILSLIWASLASKCTFHSLYCCQLGHWLSLLVL